nr:group II intron maturase-specific domain-containing protein [Bradyrhizobium sp. 186]
MADIARQLNPLLREWIAYYVRFTRAPLGQTFDTSIRQSRLG